MLYASWGMQTEMMISGRLLPVVCGLQWCDAKRYFPRQSFITLHSGQSAMRYVHRLCFFSMLCHTPGRKPPCFLPSPLFPGFSRASSETLGLSRKIIAPAFTGRLPLAVFPFTRGLLLALRSSSQLLLLGFCS